MAVGIRIDCRPIAGVTDASLQEGISIPLFSQGNVTFFPTIQLAPVGISVPAFISRSDLWYIPTLRTFLLYKFKFQLTKGNIGAGREQRPRFDLPPKRN